MFYYHHQQQVYTIHFHQFQIVINANYHYSHFYHMECSTNNTDLSVILAKLFT